MQFVQLVEQYPSRRVQFELFPLGDIHDGLIITDWDKLDERISYIKSHKYARWIGMGEYCDLIVPGDPRYDPKLMSPWVDTLDVARSQYEHFLEKVDPIKDKCWGLLNDNHSETMRLKINRDVYSDLVRALGTNRLGFECFLNVSFQRGEYKKKFNGEEYTTSCITKVHFWLHHGWFGGRLMGETALNLERLPKSYDADVYLVAHGHKGMIIPLKVMTARHADLHGNRPISMSRWAMMTQHWLDVHKSDVPVEGWHARRGFWPQPTGSPVIRIKPSARYIECAMSGVVPELQEVSDALPAE